MFEALQYFKHLGETNLLAAENDFFVGFCSGMDGIGEALEQYQSKKNFILIDDITSQRTYSNGVGYFEKNAYTVFILMSMKWNDVKDRNVKLEICRRIFRQMHSRMIHDKYVNPNYTNTLSFLDTESVYSREFPFYFDAEHTGLYFMVNNDEPVDLVYKPEEWQNG